MAKKMRVDDLFHKKLKDPKFRALFLKEQEKLEAGEKAFGEKKNKQRKK